MKAAVKEIPEYVEEITQIKLAVLQRRHLTQLWNLSSEKSQSYAQRQLEQAKLWDLVKL